MIINVSILFFSAFFAGIAVFFMRDFDIKRFKVILAFSGAYLFSITVVHILPELFHDVENITEVGIYVLIGFFLQMILEYFTSGVEHGHVHVHEEEKSLIPYSMLISLSLHALLEGTLLVHPSHGHHGTDEAQPLVFGLVLHKIPEAFALMSVLAFRLGRKYMALILLIFFSMATPAGMIFSNLIYSEHLVTEKIFIILFALVAGNFLYISTTIFFETSPNHKFKANKLLISVLGALTAIIAEYLTHQ